MSTPTGAAVPSLGGGGQRSRVLGTGKPAQGVSAIPGMDLLRRKMQEAAVEGPEVLEQRVGELITQDSRLILTAGDLLAERISRAPGIGSHSIDAIVEVGSGKDYGLGLALSLGLTKIASAEGSNLKINPEHKIFCYSWDDTEVAPIFRELRTIKVVIVTASKTAETARKLNDFIDTMKSGMSNNSDFIIKICSLVGLNNPDDTVIPINVGSDKNIFGTLISY